MNAAFMVQLALLAFYAGLTVLFGLKRETWPLSLYYIGCIVKDAGVFILGWLLVSK